MANFVNAQTYAVSNYLTRIGQYPALTSDAATSYFNVSSGGFSMLGPMNPARDSISTIPCLPYIAETAPFTEDESGVAYDNDNLYWVRTTVAPSFDEFANPNGITDSWVPVPRALPAGYTAVGRCGLTVIPGPLGGFYRIADVTGEGSPVHPFPTFTPVECDWSQPHLVQDFYNEAASELTPAGTLMQGFRWNHRTAGGLLWDSETVDGFQRCHWTPMACNDEVLAFSNTGGGSLTSDATYNYQVLYIGYHVGFRGINVVVTDPGGSGVAAAAGDTTFYLLWTDPNDEATLDWGDYNQVWSRDASDFGAAGEYVQTGSYYPATIGRRMHYWIGTRTKIIPTGVAPDVELTIDSFKLSPRTDVPLPFFVSTRNRVAPGGVYLP